jgi:hypothetical protein
LEKPAQIRGISFRGNSRYKKIYGLAPKQEIGLVAQEVEKVFPELFERGNKNYRLVHYGKVTAVLVEAVKQLKAEDEFLQKRLAKLEKPQKTSN